MKIAGVRSLRTKSVYAANLREIAKSAVTCSACAAVYVAGMVRNSDHKSQRSGLLRTVSLRRIARRRTKRRGCRLGQDPPLTSPNAAIAKTGIVEVVW
jgi:hypothetical protein